MPRFNRPISLLTAAAILAATALGAPAARAEGEAGGIAPLMVVRFNQSRVYYDQQLYSAISQAVTVKPDVMFDVVSNAPLTGDSSRDSDWVTTASRNTQSVVATMQSIGVPMERMRITGQAKPGIRYDETHIYVR